KQERIMQGPEGGPPPPPDANMVFFATESFGGKTVKGAPYSAEAVTETIQTPGDGNRIINRISSMLYRDSEGRTRREQSLKGLGIFSSNSGEEPFKTIFINDPVAGVTYALDSRSQTAHKSVPFTFEFSGKKGEQFEFKVAPGSAATTNSMIVTAPLAAGVAGVRATHPPVDQFTMKTEAGVGQTFVFRTKTDSRNDVKEE